MRLHSLRMKNFLSYRDATIAFGDLTALVGPNASGKSNAVAAIRLLHEIPIYGLPTAIARRGGFDQLRHRSRGRPYDPAVQIDFTLHPDAPLSRYELHLGAIAGGRYEVKLEKAAVEWQGGQQFSFVAVRGKVDVSRNPNHGGRSVEPPEGFRLPVGQSAVSGAGGDASYMLWDVLSNLGTLEINPARVGELQDPTAAEEFEPDGSNTASLFELLPQRQRQELVDHLAALVPGISKIDPRRFSDKLTLAFYQHASGRPREFLAKQMSDGTLRAFSILLALVQEKRPDFLVIEEPEVAIHLGALRTLVDVLRLYSEDSQLLITTHSADIIDALEVDDLRVVWNEEGASHVAPVADHTREPVRRGLVTPGELLRADSLDPAPA